MDVINKLRLASITSIDSCETATPAFLNTEIANKAIEINQRRLKGCPTRVIKEYGTQDMNYDIINI